MCHYLSTRHFPATTNSDAVCICSHWHTFLGINVANEHPGDEHQRLMAMTLTRLDFSVIYHDEPFASSALPCLIVASADFNKVLVSCCMIVDRHGGNET